MKKQNLIIVFFLALVAFYCILPLVIHTGLPYSHDIIFHIFQADQFNKSIHNGVFYPRWVLDSNNGYGSPNFVFYSPLSYYLVSAINIFTPSITIAMIVALWCGFFFSGVTMFIAIKKLFKGSRALVPAILYQLLPFHLSNLYIRGTFAEIFAFIWLPLIMLFMYETIIAKNKHAMAGLSISYAGLILTHLVSAFIFSFVIGAYYIYNCFFLRNKLPLFKTFVPIALGLGLSSVYLIPVIFERQFVHIDYITRCPVGNYKTNFLFTWDKVQTVLRNFYIPLHGWVILEVILFLFIILLMHKNRSKLPSGQQQNFFIFLFPFAFFLTIPLSRPIWDIVPGFPFLQFPWRWVPIMELSLCFLTGALFSVENMSSLKPTYLKRMFIYLLTVLLLISLMTITKSKIIPETLINEVINPEQVNRHMDPTIEYIPKWVSNVEEIMPGEKYDKITITSGIAQYSILEWRSEKRIISIKAIVPTLLRISTFYYPGWVASLDRREIRITIEKQTGAMLVNVPEGNHELRLVFNDTPIRYYGKMISLFSLFIVFMIVVKHIFESNK